MGRPFATNGSIRRVHQMRCEQIEVFFCTTEYMIPIDSQQTNRLVPSFGHISRKGAVSFDALRQSRGPHRYKKFLELRRAGRNPWVCRRRCGVRVDRHDRSPPIVRSNGGQHDSGFALKAANLNNRSLCRRAGYQYSEKPRRILRKKTWNSSRFLPRYFKNVVEIRR